MRTIDLRPLLIAGIAACTMPLAVHAQSDAPPQLQKLEEGEPPAVTIRKPESKSRITEKRAPGGRVTEIKVTAGGSTYYLKPNVPDSEHVRGAQWEIKEFDLGQRDRKRAAEEAAGQAPEPPQAAPSKQQPKK